MKLKQILFGSLLLAVPFTACTNEELLDVNAPVATLDKAVALGEGYTIVGTKGVESRIVIDNKFSQPTWEVTDTVGGAWIGYQTEEEAEDTANDPFANKFNSIMSNHPFAFSKDLGGMKSVEFKAPTNVFQGKHILYYPFNADIKGAAEYIPVKFEQNPVMDCTEGKELEHVNANTFAWTTHEAKGGPEAGEFELTPINNIWVIKLGADEANIDRVENQTVEKVILESAGNLYSEARLFHNGAAKYAKFGGALTTVNPISTYILTPENAGTDYEVTKAGTTGLTKKPFYISTHRASSAMTEFTVRVIMSNGRIFSKTIELDTDDAESVTLFRKIAQVNADGELTNSGNVIKIDVILDTEEDADKVYTSDQLSKQLAQSGVDEIELGADITLSSFTFNKKNKSVNITGNKMIIAGDMNVAAGELNIENLKVEGELSVTGILNVDHLEAEDAIEVASNGVFNATAVEETKLPALTVNGGAASVTADEYSAITLALGSDLTVNQGTIKGALKIAKKATANLYGVTLAGNTTIVDGDLNLNAYEEYSGGSYVPGSAIGSVNKGTITSTNSNINCHSWNEVTTWENVGTVNAKNTTVNSIVNHGAVTFTGDRGYVNDMTNAAMIVDVAHPENNRNAGSLTVNLATKNDELQAAVINQPGTTVTITKGIVIEEDDNAFKLESDYDSTTGEYSNGAVMTISSNGRFIIDSSSAAANYMQGTRIVVAAGNAFGAANLTAANIPTQFGNSDIAVEITTQAHLNGSTGVKPWNATGVETVILNCGTLKVKSAEATVLQDKNLLVKSGFTFEEASTMTMTKSFNVDGTVTVKAKAASTITLTGDNYMYSGKLTIGEYVTMDGTASVIVVGNAVLPENAVATTAGADDGDIDWTNLTIVRK